MVVYWQPIASVLGTGIGGEGIGYTGRAGTSTSCGKPEIPNSHRAKPRPLTKGSITAMIHKFREICSILYGVCLNSIQRGKLLQVLRASLIPSKVLGRPRIWCYVARRLASMLVTWLFWLPSFVWAM